MNARKIAFSLVSAFVATSLVVGMTGCVAEQFDVCSPALRLTFRYTNNTLRKDMFVENVRSVDLYVFDDCSGVLTDVIGVASGDISRGRCEIAFLPAGTYTMLAWGSSGKESSRSYAVRQTLDGALHDNTGVETGVTTIDDFRMMLESASAPVGTEGDVVPATPEFDDLFWAVAQRVEVIEGESRRVDLDFICNTSTLRISVAGLEYFESTAGSGSASDRLPLRLFATGRNGCYLYDDTTDRDGPTVHYASLGQHRTPGGMSLYIPMQRLQISGHEAAPVLLHIESLAGAIPGINPIDLVSAITGCTGGTGNYPYGTQTAIDREHEFRIALAISPDPDRKGWFRLSMTINEKDTIILTPVVDRPDQ